MLHPVFEPHRITVDGSTGVDNYLRVSVNPSDPQVLTIWRCPFAP
jgi:hypothetical protein